MLYYGQSIGRWGNFFNIEAYGVETQSLLKMGIMENGIYKEVHPAFLYESLSTFIIFIILIIKKKNRKFEGEIFYLYLILYSFVRTIIEGIRTDSLMLANLRISQVLSIIIFVITILYVYYKNKKIVGAMHKK